jgi:hypothetical protein
VPGPETQKIFHLAAKKFLIYRKHFFISIGLQKGRLNGAPACQNKGSQGEPAASAPAELR